jgi:hypothetical protein
MALPIILVPSAPRLFDERSSDVNALLLEKILGISVQGYQDMALCDRATYMHLGRKAAMLFAPSTPR